MPPLAQAAATESSSPPGPLHRRQLALALVDLPDVTAAILQIHCSSFIVVSAQRAEEVAIMVAAPIDGYNADHQWLPFNRRRSKSNQPRDSGSSWHPQVSKGGWQRPCGSSDLAEA